MLVIPLNLSIYARFKFLTWVGAFYLLSFLKVLVAIPLQSSGFPSFPLLSPLHPIKIKDSTSFGILKPSILSPKPSIYILLISTPGSSSRTRERAQKCLGRSWRMYFVIKRLKQHWGVCVGAVVRLCARKRVIAKIERTGGRRGVKLHVFHENRRKLREMEFLIYSISNR